MTDTMSLPVSAKYSVVAVDGDAFLARGVVVVSRVAGHLRVAHVVVLDVRAVGRIDGVEGLVAGQDDVSGAGRPGARRRGQVGGLGRRGSPGLRVLRGGLAGGQRGGGSGRDDHRG
jgi:hypothetical protein